MTTREPVLTVFIDPDDEGRVIDQVAQRFPLMSAISFDDTEDDPSLREQWMHEHPRVDPGERRCRLVVIERGSGGETGEVPVSQCAEHILDVIAPHARSEAARTPPFEVTPDEIPWTAHVTLWSPDR